jgi:translation initiation factor IF-2
VVSVLNKADQASPAADELLTNLDKLKLEVVEEKPGAMADLALRYVEAVRDLSKASRLVKVSAKTGFGLEALYDLVRESLCVCGDLT